MQLLNRILHRLLSWFAILLFVVLVVDVVLGVTSRYVFDSELAWVVAFGETVFGGPLRWTDELATFLLVWLVFSGAAIAYYDKAHLGINLMVERMDPAARKLTQVVSLAVVFVFVFSVMVWGGGQLVIERFDAGQMMPTLGIHKAWQYLSIPFSGLFIAWFNIGLLMETLKSGEQVASIDDSVERSLEE